MNKLFALLLVAALGQGFAQEAQDVKDAASQTQEASDQAQSVAKTVSKSVEGSDYVDMAPRVGLKLNLGTAATLGDRAIQELGFVLAPTILATMNFNQSVYMTGEMIMTQSFMPYTADTDIEITSIDPTLVFGYRFSKSFSFYVGPQYNLLMSVVTVDDGVETELLDLQDPVNSGISVVAGTRMNYGEKYFSDFRAQYGLSEIVKNSEVTTYSVTIGGGVYF